MVWPVTVIRHTQYRFVVYVCYLAFVIPLLAVREATAAANFTGISLYRPRPALSTLVGLPNLLCPSPPEKRNKGKDKGKVHSVWPAPGLTAPPSPRPPPTRTRTPFPPLAPPPVTGPEGVFSGVEGRCAPHSICTWWPTSQVFGLAVPLAPAHLSVDGACWPHGPLVGARPFECGRGALASRPSRWCPPTPV